MRTRVYVFSLLLLLTCLLATALTLVAQSDRATLTGRLSDPDGGPVALAAVQVTSTATGEVFKATSSSTGNYTLAGLQPGTYDLVIPAIGFSFDRQERKGITLRAGQAVRLDIGLPWGGNLGTPGDDVSTTIRLKNPVPGGPTPRTPDGRPDFSGVWIGVQEENLEDPALLPWADALVKARQANSARDHPSSFCLPGNVVLAGSPFLYKIVQTPSVVILLWEGNFPGHHQVFLDGRRHPQDFNPTWMGHSVGRWEGDALVVDTVGFNDLSWIGLVPHTEMLHVVERYRRIDLGHLEKDITIEDPGTFTRPWRMRATWELVPGEEVQEYICDGNR